MAFEGLKKKWFARKMGSLDVIVSEKTVCRWLKDLKKSGVTDACVQPDSVILRIEPHLEDGSRGKSQISMVDGVAPSRTGILQMMVGLLGESSLEVLNEKGVVIREKDGVRISVVNSKTNAISMTLHFLPADELVNGEEVVSAR